MQNKIFLNYRRKDSAGHVGRIFDWLTKYFGPRSVFLDVDGLLASQNFEARISGELNTCSVFIAVIGLHWGAAFEGRDGSEDFVQREIVSALEKKGLLLIPVLVGGARLPEKGQVPEALHGLLLRQALEVYDNDFAGGVEKIVAQIEGQSGLRRKKETRDVKVECVICASERMHSQSAPSAIQHFEPGTQVYNGEEFVTSLDTIVSREVKLRCRKGCGTTHLQVTSWDNETTDDDGASFERFEVKAYRRD